MKIERFTDVTAFDERVSAFLLEREAEHNLMLGLIRQLAQHPDHYDAPPYLATVSDGDTLVGVSLRTPPHNVILSHIAPEHLAAVCDLLVADYHATYDNLPGVVGRKDLVHRFAERWQAHTGQAYEVAIEERIYQLTEVIPVDSVTGTSRLAEEADRDLYLQWIIGFHKEALGETLNIKEANARFDRYMLTESALILWEVDGQPVSMAGVAGLSPNGARIGPVYTPPEQRKHGYGSAVTAAISQRLRDSGRQFCFLYTDLSNPTSNHIYQEIGYAPVCDVDMIRFKTL